MASRIEILYAALNGVEAIVFLALAGLVLAGRRSRLNVLLALYLGVYAANLAVFGFSFVAPDPFLEANASFYSNVTAAMNPLLYLAFLPSALVTPLLRPLRPRVVQATLVGLAFALLAAALLIPARTLEFLSIRPLGLAMTWMAVAVGLFATLASLSALWRAPPGSLARRRAKAYLLAFVFNDISIVAGYGGWFVAAGRDVQVGIVAGVAPIVGVVFAFLLARALLRDQLFDFDLKLKLNLKRGTVVAVFLGVFFVAAQVASTYLQGALGWLTGGIAAGALLLAIRPIERAADRLADRAMPQVQDTPEYRTVKKREVYRAAIEGALDDGAVTDKERAMLARLGDQLGLSAVQMLEIEREARGAAGVA